MSLFDMINFNFQHTNIQLAPQRINKYIFDLLFLSSIYCKLFKYMVI